MPSRASIPHSETGTPSAAKPLVESMLGSGPRGAADEPDNDRARAPAVEFEFEGRLAAMG
jgi:hypothetical protein